MANKPVVLVAGATGMLGSKIVSALLAKGATEVKAIVRPGSNNPKIAEMKAQGATIVEGDLMQPETLKPICAGVDIVISTVGNNEETVPAQKNLIDVAKAQGVKRFIPSDYSVDYRKLDYGDNDNLDKRKEVLSYLQQSGLEYTLILNGAFMDNVGTPYMPQFNFDEGTFEYWGDRDTLLDFTTTDDTAKYIAEAVSDPDLANTALEVAGDVLSHKQILAAYEEVTGKKLQEKRLGSVEELKAWIEQKKPFANSPVEYVPQQYEYTMVSSKGKLDNIQNSRYPNIKPLTVRQFLEQADL